jgi:dTMP kinase
MPDNQGKKGFFISFEGIDGSGKGTQIDLLVEQLESRGMPVTVNREPGGTRIGQQIRAILLDPVNSQLRPTAELLLYFASRAQAVEEVILPALAEGKVVISDRFTDSTLAYQGVARGLGTPLIRQLESIACGGTVPDLTILLDVRPETSLQRTSARNQKTGSNETRFDEESIEFHTRVRTGYLEIAAADPARFLVIDGEQPRDEVAAAIRDAVLPRIITSLLKG